MRGGERQRVQCLLQHWGRGRGRREGGQGEGGVAGLTELLLSQYSSATRGPEMLDDGYRLVHSAGGGQVGTGGAGADGSTCGGRDGGAAQNASSEMARKSSQTSDARGAEGVVEKGHGGKEKKVEAWTLEEERSWEAFFVGLLNVWPHFHVCGARRWWTVTCRGASGECSICREALSSHVGLSALPLVRVRQPLHGDGGIGAEDDDDRGSAEVNREGTQLKWVAPVILECLHVFHASCVEEWFRRRERSGVHACTPARMHVCASMRKMCTRECT